MMIRRLLFTAVLLASTAAVAGAFPATYRVGGNDVTLDGRTYSLDDIAVVAYNVDNPTSAEVNSVPAVDNNPSELQRHALVMRDGSVVMGKLYKFSPDGSVVTFDQLNGGRRDFPASTVSRLYVHPGSARALYAPMLAAAQQNAAPVDRNGNTNSGGRNNQNNGGRNNQNGGQNNPNAGQNNPNAGRDFPNNGRDFPNNGRDFQNNGGRDVLVLNNQQWVSSGFTVRRGETLRFSAQSRAQQSDDRQDRFGRAGDRRRGGRQQRGALIARINNGDPFLIGDQEMVVMPANGQLFLRVDGNGQEGRDADLMVRIGR